MTSAARTAGNLLDGVAPRRKGSEPRLFDRDHKVMPGLIEQLSRLAFSRSFRTRRSRVLPLCVLPAGC